MDYAYIRELLQEPIEVIEPYNCGEDCENPLIHWE